MADGSLIFDTKLDASGLSTGLGKLGGVAGTVFKGMAVGAGAAATAVGFLTTSALNGYSAYEQLAGGVETLFKDSSDTLMEYANGAYKTAGMSANAYMETVTSFSASLIQSLDGDTAKAATAADRIITDMSDNVNKMGTDVTLIQNAYNGFAKGNFTMLDNLKLGYGGTQAEMQRLLEDAEAISGVKYDISSFNDITEAIHVIQTEIGITGTTAKEASTTIEGSVASAKAAWGNLVVGIANDNANLDVLIDQFIDSVVVAAGNILPRIEIILNGISKLIQSMLPVLLNMIPGMIESTLPQLLAAGVAIVDSLLSGITQNLGSLLDLALDVVMQLVDVFLANLPKLIEVGLQAIVQLALGIAGALPTLVPTIISVVTSIVQILIDNAPLLLDAALQLILGLADGLLAALPTLIDALPAIIDSIVNFLAGATPQIINAGIQLFVALVSNMPRIISGVVKAVPQIISSIVSAFGSYFGKMSEVGLNLIRGLWQGISGSFEWIKGKISGWVGNVLDFFKKTFGIASPSKKFKWIGEMCVAGFDEGMEDVMDGSAITRSINASANVIKTNSSSAGGLLAGGFHQTINVNREISTPDELARTVRLESKYGLMKGVAFADG